MRRRPRRPTAFRLVPALLAAALGSSGCTPPVAPPPPPQAEPPPLEPTLAEVGDEILDAWFQAQPVTATSLGEHRYDAMWPDLSAAGIAADRRRIDDSLARLDAMPPKTPDEKVDHEMLRNELLRQQFVHEVEQPWTRDPMWYAGLVGSGLEDLVSRDFAPLTERAQNVAARLERLPAFVEIAIANLQPGVTLRPQTEVAVGQLDGAIVLVEQVIGERLQGARPDDLARIEAAKAPAVAAIAALQTHVRDVLLPDASDQWRLGADHYARKLQLTLQTDISASQLRRTAILEHARVRTQMAKVATELAEHLFGSRGLAKIRRKAHGHPQRAIVRAVLDELATYRVTPPRLRDRIADNLQRLDAFVRDHDLVTMDDAEVLEVIWTPPHQRGVFIAGLAAPGPLDAGKPGLPSFYLVQPVPEDWAQDVQDSFLREYNNFMIEVLSIHEAIPGHFVQLYYGKREPSKIRKVLANGAFVEGWAVYAERMMVDAGYAGAPPTADEPTPRGLSKPMQALLADDELRAKAIRLHALKFYLRTITNAILDQAVHAEQMDELSALELMVERSFQQEGEARGKWVRAQVTSTQLSTYFVGAQAWINLRQTAEQRAQDAGAAFDDKAFHDAALSHGAPAMSRLPDLLWPAEPAAQAPAGGETPPETTLGGGPVEATEPDPDPEPTVVEDGPDDEPLPGEAG